MQAKFYNQTPPALLVLAAFAFFLLLMSRESFFKGDLPAFLPLNDNFVCIELSGEFDLPGVYQINDALPLNGVINMTVKKMSHNLLSSSPWDSPLQNGEMIEMIAKDSGNKSFRRGWMSASHRVSMGIPLHPDRMSFDDWQFLPGIGAALAGRIELNRQNNGDFVSLEGLARVQGVGLKSIEKWRVFFSGI